MAEGRDEKGRLLPGYSLFGKSNKIKNGRKKTVKGKVKDALQIAEEIIPQLFLDMIHDAQAKDTPIATKQDIREYLADRIYGKPNQPLSGLSGKPLEIIVRWATEEKKEE